MYDIDNPELTPLGKKILESVEKVRRAGGLRPQVTPPTPIIIDCTSWICSTISRQSPYDLLEDIFLKLPPHLARRVFPVFVQWHHMVVQEVFSVYQDLTSCLIGRKFSKYVPRSKGKSSKSPATFMFRNFGRQELNSSPSQECLPFHKQQLASPKARVRNVKSMVYCQSCPSTKSYISYFSQTAGTRD